MEDSMTHFVNTTAARHTLISALIALALSAGLPQAALGATSDGTWKVDAAKSSFSSGSAALSTERVTNGSSGAGSVIVVSKGNVYLVTGATAYDRRGIEQLDYSRMATQGKAVLIGKDARSTDACGFRCQGGLPEPKMTLRFRPVAGADQHINDMLAQRN
jgi:hypothetical protein